MAITQRLTLKEFLALPEEKPALEFVDGEIRQKMSPKGQHSWLQFALAERINGHARPRKLAMAFPELRTTFGGRSFVPDVAVYLWERVPRDADGRIANDFLEPPDIAVEIVSAGQSVNSQVRRCVSFVESGVRIALMIDPVDASIVIFRPGTQAQVLTRDEQIDLSDVLPDFTLTVQELFESLTIQ